MRSPIHRIYWVELRGFCSSNEEFRMFIDETTVELAAGKGGDGCFSMRRARYIPKGGPDGGDGGRGGDFIVEGSGHVGDLRAFHFKSIWKAQNGEPGRGKNQHGAGGKDCRILVPPGTQFYDDETGELVAEVVKPGEEFILLRGGTGGRGNTYFKSAIDQAPRRTTPGEPGEGGRFRLILKTVADVGLVGFPNAGKSSLIGLLTRAQPKTGHYAFTTRNPVVGVVHYPEDFGRLVMADIPGLIAGAAENKGMGHRFLRHIERCLVLLVVLDAAGVDGRDPVADYIQLMRELEAYDPVLREKPMLIAANKMDEESSGPNLVALREALDPELSLFPISCLSEEGLPELKEGLRRAVEKARAGTEEAPAAAPGEEGS